MRVVQTVARFRSIGYESDKIAHKLHKPPATVSTALGSTPSLPGCGVWRGGVLREAGFPQMPAGFKLSGCYPSATR